jgi:hypothetical protein
MIEIRRACVKFLRIILSHTWRRRPRLLIVFFGRPDGLSTGRGEPTVTNDSWFWVAMRGFGLFILLYLAVAFVVTIVSFFVYGGIVPIIISAGIVVLFVLFYMAIKRAGNTTDIH